MQDKTQAEYYYAPVFILGELRFVWFTEQLIAGTPEEAKKIGLELEKGYALQKVPVEAARTVARFKADGNYAMAMIGPEENQRPVIVLNPGTSEESSFEHGAAQRAEVVSNIDPVEETPYDRLGDTEFVKSVKW